MSARSFMKHRNDRKDQRRLDSEERTEYWQGLSPTKQLKELDRRLGKDIGAKKQRARLQALFEDRTSFLKTKDGTSPPKKEEKKSVEKAEKVVKKESAELPWRKQKTKSQ